MPACRADGGQEGIDALCVGHPGQQGQHHAGVAALVIASMVVPRRRPDTQHVAREFMRIAPQSGVRLGTAGLPAQHQIVQIRQHGGRAGLAQHGQAPVLRPQHQGGALIGALERSAFVSGGLFEGLLVELQVLQRTGGADFFVNKWGFIPSGGLAIGALPVGQRQAAVKDFADLESVLILIVLVIPPTTPAARSRIAGVLGRAAFLQRQQRQMQIAAGLPCGLVEHRGSARIGALERGERNLGRCVGVLQRVDEFVGSVVVVGAFAIRPALQQAGQTDHCTTVVRRRRQAPASFAQQVVDQHQAAPRRHRQHFM